MCVWRYSLLLVVAMLSTAACVSQPVDPQLIQVGSITTDDRSVLAGEWEYEDGVAVTLRLDEQGNGTYAYKEGRFETQQLEDHTWVGTWHQKENDREGGFVVQLSPDYTEGDGIWWYTRIGADHTPSHKGGTFRLSKRDSFTKLDDTPSAP